MQGFRACSGARLQAFASEHLSAGPEHGPEGVQVADLDPALHHTIMYRLHNYVRWLAC